jgi:catalase
MSLPSPDGDRPDRNPHIAAARVDNTGHSLTTDQGIPIPDTDNSLLAGVRGPTLLEDFHFREKIMRFDHERIPERVVHARGSGAHGYFRVYESLAEYTSADFLCDPDVQTPVFVRFSTVQGSRGSIDTPRDVRGFATKFYTRQGNFDLVGNNMPVFFIQDGIKFPDLVHALKPEPHHEMPQAASAHDTFWDFVTLAPETMHHVIWLMSDRALPRSYRTMQGFGVHTFKLVNAAGEVTFVKFHWSPVAGVHSLVWEEAQQIAGQDPDFNRRDLWESIEAGRYPEYELGIQFIPANREFDFDVDLLDPTKIIPEEQVPVTPVGRLVLDRNPDNFFAETEQVAFCVSNVVPGIGFTDDPLLQARLFSYLDTQLTRLGGPNFAQLPVNQPLAPVHHHQQDGFHQHQVPTGQANYHPNSLGGGCPVLAGEAGYVHPPERLDGIKERKRSSSYSDYYSQATLFWNSMSVWEREHIVAAYRFELGKVARPEIRLRMLAHLTRIDTELAEQVAVGLGLPVPDPAAAPIPNPEAAEAVASAGENRVGASPALSQALPPAPGSAIAHALKLGIEGRKVAVLAADGFRLAGLAGLQQALTTAGAVVELVAPTGGTIPTEDAEPVPATRALPTTSSVLYDAVVVADGPASVATLVADGQAALFVAQAYRYAKPIVALGAGRELLDRAGVPAPEGSTDGVVLADAEPGQDVLTTVVALLAGHRVFSRHAMSSVAG